MNETLQVLNATKIPHTCKFSGVSSKHFVYECALIDFNRFIMATVPLH